jgi:hypothetical protein
MTIQYDSAAGPNQPVYNMYRSRERISGRKGRESNVSRKEFSLIAGEYGPRVRRPVAKAVSVSFVAALVCLLAGCSIGLSEPPLTNTDVADILAPSVAGSTAGDLAAVQDLMSAHAGSYSQLPEPIHPYGMLTSDASRNWYFGGWTSQVDSSLADRVQISSRSTGQVERSRVNGTFTSYANLRITGNAVPFTDSSRLIATGRIHRLGSITYVNWIRTLTMHVATDLTVTLHSVVFKADANGGDRKIYRPVEGTVSITGSIVRVGTSAVTGREAEWNGTAVITFNGSENATVAFPNGEQKLINLTTGDVVQ